MKIGRFQAILDAYGAAPERWPEDERDIALALSRSSIVAARALAQARTLDAALNEFGLAEVVPDAGQVGFLHARIMGATRPIAVGRFSRWLGLDITAAQIWPSMAGLAFAMMLGFAVGIAGLLEIQSVSESEEATIITTADALIADAGR